ncbi:MAG: HNH endonuclease [Clostridium celatum]|nr:HNH endonuclease [Clostridium celatum]MDU4979849.1 HNH endonuclease [Clostridium celatum]
MALYKYCSCGKKIEYIKGKCDSCKAKAEEYSKERKKRYRDRQVKDKEMMFYNTKEWTKLRNYIVNAYMNMSVYSYYKEGKIVESEVVHHIVELREDWSKRLDKFNLIPLARKEHQSIHNRIEREGKEKVRLELEDMVTRFREEFGVEL